MVLCIPYIKTSFSFTRFLVATRSSDSQADFWFLIDEVRYVYHDMDYAEDGSATLNPTGTATINVQLTAGQIVRVENDNSITINGTDASGVINTWFTSYMLYAL